MLEDSESVPVKESDDEKEKESTSSKDPTDKGGEEEERVKGRRGRKRKIYDKNDSPDVIKEKRKKRAVELKLSKLKWTLNQQVVDVSGKRQKKAPQRFELAPVDKRKSYMDDCPEGRGTQLGNIAWIHQHLQNANLYTLRLLHRTIYRKQGMFSEKHIRRSVVKFRGFPFDGTHEEVRKRREQLERTNVSSLGNLCDLLALRRSGKDVMIDRIIGFLLCPTQKSVDEFLKDTRSDKFPLPTSPFSSPTSAQKFPKQIPLHFLMNQNNPDAIKDLCMPSSNNGTKIGKPLTCRNLDVKYNAAWKKPVFFSEGNGVKLKYIRTIEANIEMANETFIELLHRLLYLNIDEKQNMRRSILEFSGLKCEAGTNNYVYRMRILSLLPVDQVKLICRVLGLPTWHRSRQLLTEGIMDFLAAPRISVMKKRVPPHFSDEITFSFDTAKVNKTIPELKSAESEEIEIFPDIHILPDDGPPSMDCDSSLDNEYLGVKLKNFSNIHYQVISTPAAKLHDVHMILYLYTSAQNNIRKNVLEFAGFSFDESSKEFYCRKSLMEQMSLEDLKTVATVLCVSQYIVDESKSSLIDAILKFLLKPSALLNSSTIMPTISPAPPPRRSNVVKKKATSTSKTPQFSNMLPEIVISEVKTLANVKESTNSSSNAISSSNSTLTGELDESTAELERMKACLSSDIQIMPVSSIKIEDSFEEEVPVSKSSDVQILPVPLSSIKTEDTFEADAPLANVKSTFEVDVPLVKVKNTVPTPPTRVTYIESDDEDDKPLSKMIGHPNDDQLRLLVTKIVKESKLEDVTMKTIIKKVFDNYPNFDLGYRKEFIKSIVRQILSQMEEQTCSVTTTVITI